MLITVFNWRAIDNDQSRCHDERSGLQSKVIICIERLFHG